LLASPTTVMSSLLRWIIETKPSRTTPWSSAIRMRMRAFGGRVLVVGCLQLYDHSSEPLSQRIVDVSGHSISFCQNGGLPALLADFGESDCQHHLMASAWVSPISSVRYGARSA
jgi:hypothetical protein